MTRSCRERRARWRALLTPRNVWSQRENKFVYVRRWDDLLAAVAIAVAIHEAGINGRRLRPAPRMK